MDLADTIRRRYGTQGEFAKAMGVSEATVSRWVSGEIRMPVHRRADAAQLLDSTEVGLADSSVRRLAQMAWRKATTGSLVDFDLARQARAMQTGEPVELEGFAYPDGRIEWRVKPRPTDPTPPAAPSAVPVRKVAA